MIAQKTSEMHAVDAGLGRRAASWSAAKTVCIAYSGLVPMSPKYPGLSRAARTIPTPGRRIPCAPMSSLLARLARTLTHHWKRGLAGAIAVIVLLGAAAGAGGEAADDFYDPGHRVPAGARPLQGAQPRASRAPTRRSSSASTRARSPTPARAPRSRARSARSRDLDGRRSRSPTRSPRAARSRATAGSRRSTSATRTEPAGPREGRTARRCSTAAETAERGGVDVAARGILIDLASEQEAPVGELIGVGIAIILLTLLFRSLRGDGGDAGRRADRRDGRPDPARRAGQAARPAVVRDGDRGDARPRRGHRLLAADHRPLPRAGGGAATASRDASAKAAATVGRVRRRRRPDRDGRDRRPARDRHPAHRQARHRARRSASARSSCRR